jgi:hypothetical protein
MSEGGSDPAPASREILIIVLIFANFPAKYGLADRDGPRAAPLPTEPSAPAAERRLTSARRPGVPYPFGGPRNKAVPAPKVGRVAWAVLVDTCAKAPTEGRVDIG